MNDEIEKNKDESTKVEYRISFHTQTPEMAEQLKKGKIEQVPKEIEKILDKFFEEPYVKTYIKAVQKQKQRRELAERELKESHNETKKMIQELGEILSEANKQELEEIAKELGITQELIIEMSTAKKEGNFADRKNDFVLKFLKAKGISIDELIEKENESISGHNDRRPTGGSVKKIVKELQIFLPIDKEKEL